MYSRKKCAAKKLSLQSARTGSGWLRGEEKRKVEEEKRRVEEERLPTKT